MMIGSDLGQIIHVDGIMQLVGGIKPGNSTVGVNLSRLGGTTRPTPMVLVDKVVVNVISKGSQLLLNEFTVV